MKPLTPELEEKLATAVKPLTPRMARFEEMKAGAARRRGLEEQVKPPVDKPYDPYNATVLIPDLFAKPAAKTYARTERAFPAGLRKEGDPIESIATLNAEQAFAVQKAKISQQKRAVYKNPKPVDAFGENATPAKLLSPNGQKQDVTLSNGMSDGYRLAGKIDGQETILSLRGTTGRVHEKLKNKFAFPEEELRKLDGLDNNWDQQMSAQLKSRMKKLLDDAAEAAASGAQTGTGIAGSFGQLVKGAASIVHKKQKSFADNVASGLDGAAIRGQAK